VSAGRQLIVNADDFGRSAGINAGVIRAHERGIVTSASLMVRWPAAVQAASYAATRPGMSLGLHFDLEEWHLEPGQGWTLSYRVVDQDDEIEAEIHRQLEAFRRLVGRDPTHLDSHQHIHRKEPVAREAVGDLASELGVPARQLSDKVAFCGDFYGRAADGSTAHELLSADNLTSIVSRLPAGITELACHPGAGREPTSPGYGAERRLELATLCDPRVAVAIESAGIELRSFLGLPVRRAVRLHSFAVAAHAGFLHELQEVASGFAS